MQLEPNEVHQSLDARRAVLKLRYFSRNLVRRRTIQREIIERDRGVLRTSRIHRCSGEIVGQPAGGGGSRRQRIRLFERENDANVRLIDEIPNDQKPVSHISMHKFEATAVCLA